MLQSDRPNYFWTKPLNGAVESIALAANELEEQPREFIKKYGMKICSGICLVANGLLMQRFATDPESANFMRTAVAASTQFVTNLHHIDSNRKAAYNYGTVGGGAHIIASIQDGLAFNAITWAMYTQAAYKASDWSKQAEKAKDKFPVIRSLSEFVGNSKDMLVDGVSKVAPQISTTLKKAGNFITNKFDVLKDPHARAGAIGLFSTSFQWLEAILSNNQDLLPIMPYLEVASAFYLMHGIFNAADSRKKQMAPANT